MWTQNNPSSSVTPFVGYTVHFFFFQRAMTDMLSRERLHGLGQIQGEEDKSK
jgi:hypothetical protein